MFITEQNTNQWTQIIKENLGVTDQNKLSWMAEYAARHEVKESLSLGVQGTPAGGQAIIPAQGVGPMFATPLNTTGMGNPAAPSPLSTTSTAPADFFAQRAGSGDIPVTTLPMALNIALMTVGFDLVPVIPAKGPWTLLNYMDFPYAGGKLGRKNEIAGIDGIGEGRENKPLYFKVLLDNAVLPVVLAVKPKENDLIAFKAGDAVAQGYFKALGRMDAGIIAEVIDVTDKDDDGAVYNTSLKAVFAKGIDAIEINGTPVAGLDADALAKSKVDFAQTQVDFIDGFANFANGKKQAMTRAQNETGTGNTIGLRLFSKWVQMGSYEVTGQVTRQQLQDLPLYGVDAVATVMEAMQNEISQSINARILEYVRALGVTNAVKAKMQGIDLNLHMGTADTTMANAACDSFIDVNGVDHKATWGNIKNAEVNTSAENLQTRQRRIASRILAASQYLAVTGRRGKATHAVVNAQIAAALIDNSAYVVAPMANTLSQTNQGLYKAGTLAGIEIYVDPYMGWNDQVVTVFRKTNGKEPGLVFMPYILSDSVQIVAEGTMSPKMLINSRYALVPVGFYPEAQFFSFVIDSPEFGLI